MSEWVYFYVRRNFLEDPDEYLYLRFFRESPAGAVEEVINDGTWIPSFGLVEARDLELKAKESDEFLPPWKPFICEAEPEHFAGIMRLAQEKTGRFTQLPPEALVERPPRGPVLWQYFTLTEEGRLVSIGRRDLNDPREHNCQFLNDDSEWVFSPYLVEYHIGFEHFHVLTDITAHEAAVLFRQFEAQLSNFKAPAEPRLDETPPGSATPSPTAQED